MKGILHKTEQGWVVEYAKHAELPLHPDFIEMMDTCFTSKFSQEVEFEIVNEWENGEVGVNGLTYAKLIKHSVDANEMICMFEPRTDTSSATICKHCGQEKFMHNQVTEVRKMVEITFLEIGRKRWEDWLEFNKKACYPDEYQSAYADGFTRGAKWMQEQLKQPKQ